MLPRGTGSEIVTCNQNSRLTVLRSIKDKIRIFRVLIVQITPCVHEVLAKTFFINQLEKLLGQDLVRVDIIIHEGDRCPRVDCKFFHKPSLLDLR